MLIFMQILRGAMALLLLLIAITVLIRYIAGAYVSDALAFLALMFLTETVRITTESMESDAE